MVTAGRPEEASEAAVLVCGCWWQPLLELQALVSAHVHEVCEAIHIAWGVDPPKGELRGVV